MREYVVEVICDYTDVGKLQYTFANKGIRVISSEYGADVTFKIVVETTDASATIKDLTEITSGKALVSEDYKCMFADADNKVLLYSIENGQLL